jgi:hypothetical protein
MMMMVYSAMIAVVPQKNTPFCADVSHVFGAKTSARNAAHICLPWSEVETLGNRARGKIVLLLQVTVDRLFDTHTKI